MREHCEYHFECVCGASIVSVSAEGFCKKCNRLFTVERQTEIKATEETKENKEAKD